MFKIFRKTFFATITPKLLWFFFASVIFFSCPALILAIDPVDQLQQEIDELEHLKQLSEVATTPLEQEVQSLTIKINNAQASLKKAKNDAQVLAEDINERSAQQVAKTTLLKLIVAQSYKAKQTQSPFLLILSPSENTGSLLNLMNYRVAQNNNTQQIKSLIAEISQLNQDKKTLEEKQIKLAALQKQLDSQADFFAGEIAKAKDYQKTLSSKIAALSAQQQAIINARSGTYTTAVGDVPLADDYNASIAYKASAPSNSFAVFSFGAYTHRNGMSQYGAKARAEAGQSAEEILAAYYPGTTLKKDYSAMGNISVDGYGSMSFEDSYLQSIYEVPASWPLETLKAQAVAARTYAIRYTSNGSKSICTTESCQVFKNSKKGGDWEKAVNETRGWVLVDNDNNPVSTQYASTHGGYTNTRGWDTTDNNGGSDWASRAWEAKANSPWFYKAWYRNGYSSSGDSCGRSHPWLSQEEMADILNAYLVRQNPGDADSGRIQPVTINSCNVGGSGGNPYSLSEMRDFANKSGGAVTSISSVTVSHNDNGQTSQVKFSTNRGDVTLSGSDFKQIFNLRAPGYLRIPQSSFASFNIEFKQ